MSEISTRLSLESDEIAEIRQQMFGELHRIFQKQIIIGRIGNESIRDSTGTQADLGSRCRVALALASDSKPVILSSQSGLAESSLIEKRSLFEQLKATRRSEAFCQCVVGRIINDLKRGGYNFDRPRAFPKGKTSGVKMIFGVSKIKQLNDDQRKSYRPIFQHSLRDRVTLSWLERRLSEAFDPNLSDCSYAFRKKLARKRLKSTELSKSKEIKLPVLCRRCPERNLRCQIYKIMAERQGLSNHITAGLALNNVQKWLPSNPWIYKGDIKRFFDSISHSILLSKVQDRVENPTVVFLLKKYLESAVDAIRLYDSAHRGGRGVLHGSSVSGILSNIFLDRIDKSISSLGGRYLRYVDDIIIMSPSKELLEKSQKAMQLLLEENYLNLNTSRDKQTWACMLNGGANQVALKQYFEYLGYSFAQSGEKVVIKIRPSSIAKFKGRLQEHAKHAQRRKMQNPDSDTVKEKQIRELVVEFNKSMGYTWKSEGDSKVYKFDVFRGWPGFFLGTLQNAYVRKQLKDLERYMRDTIRFAVLGETANAQSAQEVLEFNIQLSQRGLQPMPLGRWK